MKRQTEDKVVRYVQGWERPPAQLYYTSIPRAALLWERASYIEEVEEQEEVEEEEGRRQRR